MKNARTLHLVSGGDSAAVASVDVAALIRVAQGDVSALGEVFDRHAESVLRYVARVSGSADAEDVVQATFLRAAKAAKTFDRRAESARPWLFGIASRIVLERRRAFARFTRALFTLGSSSPAPASVDAVRTDVERALDRLSPAKRIVVILAEVEEYTCEEIALMLDVPVGTVWTRLHHARRQLRAHFEETV
jgi:RNA polymerase sigma factor (sigma-70 family)